MEQPGAIAEEDAYAKGMVESGEEHFGLTPELDRFQYRMIRPHLGRHILEVGAGPGRLTELLLDDEIAFDSYIASEPSHHFFNQLTKRLGSSARVTFVQGETSDLASSYANAFDTIFSAHVLEHVEHDRRFVEDCLTMLKPGGKLVTLVPALQFLYSDLDRNIGHYRRYDKRMVRKLVAGLNCSVSRLYYTNCLAIIPSLVFFKLGKIDYQKSVGNKRRFMFLEHVYSKYFIPLIDAVERRIPVPIGLNLTFVVEKLPDLSAFGREYASVATSTD